MNKIKHAVIFLWVVFLAPAIFSGDFAPIEDFFSFSYKTKGYNISRSKNADAAAQPLKKRLDAALHKGLPCKIEGDFLEGGAFYVVGKKDNFYIIKYYSKANAFLREINNFNADGIYINFSKHGGMLYRAVKKSINKTVKRNKKKYSTM